MSDAFLFAVTNQQCEDSGPPPVLPADFATGNYYRSYFQNKYGEQWIFWKNLDTGEYQIRGGDCGWEKVMTVVATDPATLMKLPTGKFNHITMAGKAVITQILSGKRPPTLFVKDADDEFVTLSLSEYLWLSACVAAAEIKLELMSVEELTEMLTKMVARSKKKDKDA